MSKATIMTALLELRGITKSFGAVRALQGVDLTLAREKFMRWPERMALENQR